MNLNTRLAKLEAAGPHGAAPRVLTEAELDDLSYSEKLDLLCGRLVVDVIDEDDGPTWEAFLTARGIDPAEARAEKPAPAVVDAHKDFMSDVVERSAARRAARLAAKGETPDEGPTPTPPPSPSPTADVTAPIVPVAPPAAITPATPVAVEAPPQPSVVLPPPAPRRPSNTYKAI